MIFDPGDPEAVAAWLAPRWELCYRAAFRILGDPAAADDAAQDALVAAVARTGALSGADDPERYLRRMAVNAALVQLRSARSRRARERRAAMPANGARLDAGIEGAAARDAVAAALEGLPEDLRAALVLRHAEDMTYAEIGAAVGCSAPTALDRLRRAEARVRERLERAGFGALALGDLVREGVEPASLPAGGAARASAALRRALRSAVGAAQAALVVLAVSGLLALVATQLTPRLGPSEQRIARGSEPTGAVAPDPLPADRGADLAERGSPPDARDSEEPRAPAPPAPPAVPPPPARGPELAAGAFVEGIVVDANRQPIEGVKVAAVREILPSKAGDLNAVVAFTDAAGEFRLPLDVRDPDGERFSLLVAHKRRADIFAPPAGRARPRAPDPDDPNAPPTPRVLEGGRLEIAAERPPEKGRYVVTGTVLDGDGVPVARAEVMIWRVTRDGVYSNADHQNRAYWPTGPDGRFTIEGRTLGPHVLTVKLAAHVPYEHRFRIEDGDTIEHTVRLDRGLTIAGRAASLDGAPLAGEVWAHRREGARYEMPFSARIGPDGSFSIPGLPGGVYDLEGPGFLKLGVAAGTTDLAIRAKTSAADERDEGDHGAEIHGPIVDADSGAPVAILPGAFTAIPLEPGVDPLADLVPDLYFPSPRQSALSGDPPPPPPPETRYHIANLKPGRYLVWGGNLIHYEGLVEQGPRAFAGPVELVAGEIRRDVRVAIPRLLAIAGEVRAEGSSEPVKDARIFVFGTGPRSDEELSEIVAAYAANPDDPERMLAAWSRTVTDAAGRFRLERVPPGVPFRLLVGAAGRRPATIGPLTLRPGASVEDVKVALEPR